MSGILLMRVGSTASNGGSAFTPASLDDLSFYARRSLQLYSDDVGTPVVDTDPVRQWVESSPNAIVGNQATLGNRPTYAAGSGGYLSFDGGDWIDFGDPAEVRATAKHTLWGLVRTTSSAGGYRQIFNYPNGFILAMMGTNLASYDWGGLAVRDSGITINDGNWKLVGIDYDTGVAGGSYFRVNGSVVGSGFTFTSTLYNSGACRIGANQNGNELWIGDIAEVGQVFGRNLTSDEWTNLKNYYGV